MNFYASRIEEGTGDPFSSLRRVVMLVHFPHTNIDILWEDDESKDMNITVTLRTWTVIGCAWMSTTMDVVFDNCCALKNQRGFEALFFLVALILALAFVAVHEHEHADLHFALRIEPRIAFRQRDGKRVVCNV